jgi:DNA mismatch repair protein MutS2
VHRVLLEVTDALRPEREALLATLDALTTLDALAARARYARGHGGLRPQLAAAGEGFAINNGRHPLLLAREASMVVPFDLTMEPGERTLLVSGPNTGGKTVLLKAMALLSLLVQSGIPAPVGPESRVPIFDRFFGDIGDEQSIAASLSTFSAHLRNLGEILREATADSLVLIDELGSGTDPVEGAALGGAILEELTRRGTFTIATTHLGALKELAQEVPGVVNASLQFDAVRLAPTYRLVKGIPGRSYGISIARRLALPEGVLERAEQRVPTGERDVTALLEDLEARQEALALRERDVAERADTLSGKAETLAARERAVKEKERELERSARHEARRLVLDSRQEIERLIKQLKDSGAQQLDETALQIRRAVEREAAAQADAIAKLEGAEREERERPVAGGEVVVGATVSVPTLGGKAGEVVGLRNGEATVMVGAMKITAPVATLRVVSRRKREPLEKATPLIGDQPDIVVRTEVDLRGMRVMEVDDAVLQAVDDAVRADLGAIRIIHGKGTGALRERVTMILRSDRRVKSSRMGAWNEGGAGVTIAELA